MCVCVCVWQKDRPKKLTLTKARDDGDRAVREDVVVDASVATSAVAVGDADASGSGGVLDNDDGASDDANVRLDHSSEYVRRACNQDQAKHVRRQPSTVNTRLHARRRCQPAPLCC